MINIGGYMKKRCRFDNGVKLYHISDKLYKDLRPLAYQYNASRNKSVKKQIGTARFAVYKYELNFFLERPTKEHVNSLIENGFSNWDADILYIYEVDLDSIKHDVNYVKVTSTPEEYSYHTEHWDTWFNEHKDLSDTEFFTAKRQYMDTMGEQLGIKNELTVKEFKTMIRGRDWCGLDYFVKLNIEHGSKKQYASMIPHLHVSVKRPIEYSGLTKLVPDNKVFYHASKLGNLSIIKKQPSRLTSKPVVFGSPNLSYVAIFCADWDDFKLSVKTVDDETFITEVYPGAINEVYKNKTGYIYTISSNDFIQNDKIQGQEFISYKDKKVLYKKKISNILDTLERDKKIHLIRI